MADEFASVAQLFATLGLDWSTLDEGLQESRVRLREISPDIMTVQQLIKALGNAGAGAGVQISELKTAIQLLHEEQKAQMLMAQDEQAGIAHASEQDAAMMSARLAEEKRLNAESNAATKSMAIQRREAQAEEEVSDAEYAALKKQFAGQVAVGLAEERRLEAESNLELKRIAEQRKKNQLEEIAADKEYLALKRQLALEEAEAARAMKASLPFLTSFAGAGGPGGAPGGDRAGLGLRFGQGGILPFIRISQNISSAIGPLMDVLFPIALMGLAVDVMDTYMKNIQGVANALSGAADQSERLATATKNMLTAVERQADDMTRIDRMARTEGVSPATVRARIAAVDTPATRLLQSQISPMATERDMLNQIIEQLKSVPTEYGRNIAAQLMGTKLGMVGAQDFTAEGIVKRKNDLDEKIIELTNHKVRLQEEEVQSMYKHSRAMEKWRDEIRELPNRLPWFMGPPALQYGGTLHGGWPQAVPSPGFPFTPIPPAPIGRLLGNGGGNGVPASGLISPSTSGAQSQGIIIQNTYSPNFHFDGIPADIVSFMRDKAEPMLVEDLAKNSRGLTQQVIKVLRSAGVHVSG